MKRDESLVVALRALVLPIYLPSFFSAIARGAAFVVLPLYALELSLGAFLISVVLAVRGLATMVADVPAGLLVAKFGDRAVMLLCLLLLAVSTALGVLPPSAFLLLTIAAGMGCFGGGWILARVAYLTDQVELQKRGRIVAVMAMLERAGGVVGPMIAGFGIEAFGYQAVFLGVAVFFLIPLVLCALFTRTSAKHTQRHVPINLPVVIARNVRTFATGGTAMVVLSMLRSGRMLFFPYMGTEIGLTESQIGLAIGIGALVDTLMFAPAGYISDRIGRKAALVPCLLVLGMSFVLLPFTDSFILFTLIVVLSGFGNGIGTGINMTMGSDYAPRYGRNHFLGVWRFIGDAGQTLGPLTLGAGLTMVGIAVAGISSGVGALIAACLVVFFVREPNPREEVKSSN